MRPTGGPAVEIDLIEEAGATTLRLVHHGLPPTDAERDFLRLGGRASR